MKNGDPLPPYIKGGVNSQGGGFIEIFTSSWKSLASLKDSVMIIGSANATEPPSNGNLKTA